MKLHISKDWIKKFNHNETEIEYIGGDTAKKCGCGNLLLTGIEYCDECIEGYRGEDE